ncbi:hypothetical protein M405DRAFT_814217 [Rhizopogon salebrosus TDB-379]|nr:hypothetical protein M405DRAFT_814217 [Rhizopogon salebrosus TDB-379]
MVIAVYDPILGVSLKLAWGASSRSPSYSQTRDKHSRSEESIPNVTILASEHQSPERRSARLERWQAFLALVCSS